jgi:hypothetical protein
VKRRRPALRLDQNSRPNYRPHLPLLLAHLRTGSLDVSRQALDERPEFLPVKDGPVALKVVAYAPPTGVPGDATNYLGGIADVLEQKTHRIAVDHLGMLVQVWLLGTTTD